MNILSLIQINSTMFKTLSFVGRYNVDNFFVKDAPAGQQSRQQRTKLFEYFEKSDKYEEGVDYTVQIEDYKRETYYVIYKII